MAVHNVIKNLTATLLAVIAPVHNVGAQTESANSTTDDKTVCAGGRTEISYSITDGKIDVNFIFERPVPIDTITLTIIGDVMMHSAQIENCRKRYALNNGGANPSDPSNYDFTPCLAPIRGILEEADICVANMEFTHSGPPFSGYPAFSAPESYSSYVADCGVNVFLMANNHILDGGSRGAMRTIGVYENMSERGVKYTGCFDDEASYKDGYPLFIECKGVKIGVVNFTYGTNVPPTTIWPKVCVADRKEIATAMKRARENADVVIVIPHWGEEYELRHSAWQDDMTKFLLHRGADAIIGGHPHVVQDVETRTTDFGKRVPVVYSLGNIISNMSATNTQIGLIVTLLIVLMSDGNAVLAEPEYTLTWCSLPGGLTDCHVTIPVRDWLNRRSEWRNPADYDKMLDTYNRILRASGLSASEEN